MKTNVTSGETPEQITISMIDQDLKDGVNKSEMAIKYGIKPWEVDEMFKHPLLKGRRPSRKKALSFTFVDDMTESTQFPNSMEDVTDEVDPNQITLHQAIDEAIESVEEIKDQVQETQDAIINMLSPTQFETPEETIAKVNETSDDEDELGVCEETGAIEWDGEEIDTDDFSLPGDVEDEDELKIPSFDDTLALVKEQHEEEGETEIEDEEEEGTFFIK